ncbi:endospore germination permease [Brevibacillus humidisoli]|uniref:GerAB/ArcD/ProY family transporter n=1 Tax=Brevibacillus humidisoli TaxID=2895522 RepID=UPI001E42133E|nr:endospore germination permease [Brevibacillus humidisoli]UFJ39832.1 endospore germination permease [Brevibacillus humidisoli]
MLDRGRIGIHQLIVLVILVTIGDSILVLPSVIVAEAKQDAWISMIIGVAAGLTIAYLFCKVGALYPRLTLVQYNDKILGKWLGIVFSLLFLLYFLLNIGLMVREIGDFMTTQIMPETPIEAILILMLSIVIMGARLGLEPIARAGETFFVWFILLFFMLVLFLSPEVDTEKMTPILAEGFQPVLAGALPVMAFPFTELLVFLMIFPFVHEPKRMAKSFLFGAAMGGTVLTVIVVLALLVLGPDLTARNIYASYSLAKQISVGDFIERIEAILAIMWLLTMYFKITLYYYASHLGLAQLLKLRDYRMLLLPMGVNIVVLAIVISPNISYYNLVISRYWPLYDITIGIIMPLLLLAVGTVRRGEHRSG